MKKNAIRLLLIFITLQLISCQKELSLSFQQKSLQNGTIDSRSNIDTYYLKGKNGTVFNLYFNRFDQTVEAFIKRENNQVPDSLIFDGLIISEDSTILNQNTLTFHPGEHYFYFSPDETTVTEITHWGGGSINCFCEEVDLNDPSDPICRLVSTAIRGGSAYWCQEWFGSCLDCDMEICDVASPVCNNESAVIVQAQSVRYFHVFEGNGIQLQIKQRNDTTFIRKNSIAQTNNIENCVFNHSDLIPQNDNLDIPEGNSMYWFIPFVTDATSYYLSSSTDPTCESDPMKPCQTLCEMQGSKGCLQCMCFPLNNEGDCDMKIGAIDISTGGVIIQSSIIIFE